MSSKSSPTQKNESPCLLTDGGRPPRDLTKMKNVSMTVTFWTTVPLDAWELTALPPPEALVVVAAELPEDKVTDAEVASEVVEA
jgi:hypothetical protein